MKRRAILIDGSQCDPNAILQGPKRDVESFAEFLNSPAGGAWEPDDVEVLRNPTVSEMLDAIEHNSLGQDYFFMLFSGHGGYIETGDLLLRAADGSVYEKKVQGRIKSPRATSVLDSCRAYQDVVIQLADPLIKEASEVANISREQAQKAFERSFGTYPAGHGTAYACQKSEKAMDTGYGGLFSQHLLSKAARWSATKHSADVADMSHLVGAIGWPVADQALQAGKFQTPEFVGTSFPFVIGTREAAV